jgi:glycerol transport system ATP-binding protein
VMHAGRIVQFGTPRELFERPRHTFVGYFIGSPGMNLIDVCAEADGVSFGDIHLALPEAVRERLATMPGGRLQVGIRPEFVQVWEQPFDDAIETRVVDVEDLGTYRILTLMLAGVTLKARLGEDRVIPRERAWVSLPPQWLMLYLDDVLVEAEA